MSVTASPVVTQRNNNNILNHHFWYNFPEAKHLACTNELDFKNCMKHAIWQITASQNSRMRVAPIDYRSLWTCMNCSILRNLLDLFSTSLLLADPAIPGLSMFGANTIIHTLQSKRRLSLQGKISKQPFSAGWNWLCQDEKKMTSKLLDPCHVL